MKNLIIILLTFITFNLSAQTIKLKEQIINETNIYKVQSQPLAIVDTIPVIDGMDQARLDSMGVIGLAKGSDGIWRAATAARDTLYPNAFCYGLLNSETEMLIAYSGVIQLDSAYFTPGTVYYQPYDYIKYQTTPDTILEQLAFKAIDGNQILIRDRYSYLADGADQTSRAIPNFVITYENFVGTNKDLYYALIPSSNFWDGSTYTNPVDQTTYTQPTVGDRPSLVDGEYFNFNSEDWLSTGAIGETDTLVAFIKYRVTTDVNFGHILGDNALQNESIMSVNNGGYKWAYQFGNPYSASSVIGLDVDRILAVRVIIGSGKIYVYDPSGETYIADQTPNLTDLQGTTLDEININANQNGGRAGIIGRIYGVYLFGGNFSNAEMQSLIENWDSWHMKGF